MGIPVIGCHCSVCMSESPCNTRLRPSGLITLNEKKILIDCGPDFRTQCLRYKVQRLDGIIFTHSHHDHVAGIDELRPLYMLHKEPIHFLLSKETASAIRHRYHYLFDKEKYKLVPKIILQELEEDSGHTTFLDIPISYFSYEQGGMKVNGFKIGNFAYVSDIRHYSETIFEELQGTEILVLSALRFDPSPFHLGIDEAVAFARRCGAQHTWLTHIAHELDHEIANDSLPSSVRMAYDGLEFDFTVRT